MDTDKQAAEQRDALVRLLAVMITREDGGMQEQFDGVFGLLDDACSPDSERDVQLIINAFRTVTGHAAMADQLAAGAAGKLDDAANEEGWAL